MAANPSSIVAGEEGFQGTATFTGFNPYTGEACGTTFAEATRGEVMAAVDAAVDASQRLTGLTPEVLSGLLRAIAEQAESVAPELVELADSETGLGSERLSGECARACQQLRLFATLLEGGDYLEAVIDLPNPGARVPQPDLRRMQVPVGPVGVFSASNFPFAFSVIGGDVASALAAGCPVVVKAHPSHPNTSHVSALAVVEAIRKCQLPGGTFSLLHGPTNLVGEALVTSPGLKAVGFTGSLAGGRALYNLAAARPDPIPVYAEMGSLNPIFVTRGTLDRRMEEFARGFVASMTISSGQYCTKPGVLFVPADRWPALRETLKRLMEGLQPSPMLNRRMSEGVARQVAGALALPGVHEVGRASTEDLDGFAREAVLLSTNVEDYCRQSFLGEEHFGPVSVVVVCGAVGDMCQAALTLRGSLTATVHFVPEEGTIVAPLMAILQQKVGRLIWNGFPTGVAVTRAMHHGGPYPAATFSEHTSVGTFAIRRWLRPVCFQSWPDALLPPALQDANPLHLSRLVDGKWNSTWA